MASPFGHTLVGLSLLNLCYPQAGSSLKPPPLIYGLVVLGASLPDLDFIPGLVLGAPSRFHHGYFHSLGLAGLFSLFVLILLTVLKPQISIGKISGLFLTLILSHLLLDYLTEAPKGFSLFWPFSEAKFLSPLPLLPRVERNLENPAFFSQALFCFSVESFLFLPLWAASLLKKGFHK